MHSVSITLKLNIKAHLLFLQAILALWHTFTLNQPVAIFEAQLSFNTPYALFTTNWRVNDVSQHC